MAPKKYSILCFCFLLVVCMAVGGYLWRERNQQIDQARQSFEPKYENAMTAAVRAHYFMFGELPSNVEDVSYLGELREPWVVDGIDRFRFQQTELARGSA